MRNRKKVLLKTIKYIKFSIFIGLFPLCVLHVHVDCPKSSMNPANYLQDIFI